MPHPPADLSPYAPINAPIDLPDDFGLDDNGSRGHAIAWIALAVFIAIVVAACMVISAVLP